MKCSRRCDVVVLRVVFVLIRFGIQAAKDHISHFFWDSLTLRDCCGVWFDELVVAVRCTARMLCATA
uniref:Secreted protein n=1 Tax=Parascaris equorum TaxID=6256 RepID=A0A914RSG5_PAREQ